MFDQRPLFDDPTPSQLSLSDKAAPSSRNMPLPNYTLSTLCPACDHPMIRHACKVRCERCGFVWDCSEL